MSETVPLLRIDRAAFHADIEALSRLTDPAQPWTRRSFTPLFLEGRAWLTERFAQAGLDVRIDPAGNLIGRWPAAEAATPVLMTGSHSDTVPGGGRFDGIAGVAASLAAVRAMRAAGHVPRHTIEVVDFLAEEPSDWGLSCIGSRGMAGDLGPRELALTGPGGETLASAIDRVGGSVAELSAARRTDVAGFLELHIEQGPVLETEGIPVGVVSAIVGIGRVRVRFAGLAGHAGTVPMAGRRDAGLALARFALAVRDEARRAGGNGHFTATIGVTRVEPGGANVVPGAAEAIVDIRAERDEAMARYVDTLHDVAAAAAAAEGCTVERIETLSLTTAVPCDEGLQAIIRAAAGRLGHATRPLASGAGHDAAMVARFAPSAMLLAPSREGKSHCPDEWTDPDALADAADALLGALVLRDSAPPFNA